MNLADIHRMYSKDETFRRAYAEMRDRLFIAGHCGSIREQGKVTIKAAAAACGVSYALYRQFELLGDVPDWVISAAVHAYQDHLRERGVEIGHWLKISPEDPRPAQRERERLEREEHKRAMLQARQAGPEPFDLSAVRGLGKRPQMSWPHEDQAPRR